MEAGSPTTKVGAAAADAGTAKSGVEGVTKNGKDEVTKLWEKEAAKKDEVVMQEVHKESTDKDGNATAQKSSSVATLFSVASTNTPKLLHIL